MTFRNRLKSVIRRVRTPKPRPLILCYHRIADEPLDPWGLAVSPANFEEQLEVLCRTRRPLPLAQFVRDLMAGTLPSNAVSLTFDDGYVDNLIAGKPRVAKAGIPATVFLVTGSLNRSGEFWWDELARLILTGSGPGSFALQIGGKSMQIRLEVETIPDIAQSETRRPALTTIWEALRRLDDEERGSTMHILRSMFTIKQSSPSGRAMRSEEVEALTKDGLVTVGAHTVTHPLLSELTAADCRREIRESKIACESLTGRSVTGFAYPFGNFNAAVREEVRSIGFSFACSVRYGPANANSDVFALPRIHIQNSDGDLFERTIRSAAVG